MRKSSVAIAFAIALMSTTGGVHAQNAGAALCSEGVLQLKQGEPERAIELLRECLAGDEVSTAARIAAHRNLVSAYLMTHRPLLAMKQVEHAMDLNPADKAVDYMLRGYVYAYHRSFSTALQAFDHALRLDPNLAEAFYQKAWVFEATGQSDEARKNYEQAYARNLSPRAWNDVLLFGF